MSRDPNDVVRVYSGPLSEVEAYQQVLRETGIESKVVGTELSASFGSALSGSIELWIHNSDMDKAVAAIKLFEAEKGKKEQQGHEHPANAGKAHTMPHRKEPHVKQDPAGN
ncbi:MAG: hypothetical protein C0467_12120 [Planctomycetaceae bacterium]|nr:hypothetical protein [Planctomycetaceae bacterium]